MTQNENVKCFLNSIGLLCLRLGIGFLMLTQHGWGKFSTFSQKAAVFPDPLGVGSEISLGLITFAEFFCSILLILGLATRLAAVPLLTGMLVAVFVIHADDPFSRKEFALLYAIPYLTLIFTGAGKISLDAIIGPKLAGLFGIRQGIQN